MVFSFSYSFPMAFRRFSYDVKLRDFRGLKEIAGIETGSRKTGISAMRDAIGDATDDRQGIADIFAEFYERLYTASRKERSWKSDQT